MKRIATVVILIAAMVMPFAVPAAAAPSLADPAMQSVWQRADQPVDQLKTSRTWMWGPTVFETKQEPYAEAPGGQRTVEYFDKSRMEVNNPSGDRTSQWFVTNGLLTKELITGQVQTGDNRFENRSPALVPVAGDPDDTNGPTYASFAGLLDKPAHSAGEQLTETVDKYGNVGAGGPPTGVTASYLVPDTMHAVASVFWDFLNSSGTIFRNGKYVQGKLFSPTFFATGFPITEAYWAQVKVAGQTKWVLMQSFERRVLTYTPDNPEGWKVEMGNVGRHYYDWRYNNVGGPVPAPDPGADVPASVNGSVSPKYGPPGTNFIISVSGFKPNEQVGFWINSADGAIGGTTDTMSIGPSGQLMNLPLPTGAEWAPGMYSVVFHGVESGHESVVYFKLISRDELPAPTPSSALPHGWTLFDDSANGYRIGVPAGWAAFKGDSPEMQQFIDQVEQSDPESADYYRAAVASGMLKMEAYDTSPEARGTGGLFTDLTVYKEKMPLRLTVDQYVTVHLLRTVGWAVTPITQQRIATPNGDLVVLKFQAERPGGLSNACMTLALGVSGDYAFMLNMATTAELEAKYSPLLDQIAQHFQVLPPS